MKKKSFCLALILILLISIAIWFWQKRKTKEPSVLEKFCQQDSDCGWGTVQGDPLKYDCIFGGNEDGVAGGYQCICNQNYIRPKCEKVQISPQIFSEVVITVDKKEYRQGEVVKITIENHSTSKKWIDSPQLFTIEKFAVGNWLEVRRILCPCGARCKIVAFYELLPEKPFEDEWDQKESWCSDGTLLEQETISSQVSPGKYRVQSRIAVDRQSEKTEIIYSEEFIIKGN